MFEGTSGSARKGALRKARAAVAAAAAVVLAAGLAFWAMPTGKAIADETVLAQVFENHPQGSATLADAEYAIDFYGGYFDTVEDAEASEAHLRHWTFKTDAHGQVLLSEDYLTGGDALYYDLEGTPVLPLGTYLLRETKAPAGYNLDSDTVFLRQVTANTRYEHVTTYETPEHGEQVKRGDISFTKAREDSQERIPGVPFLITSLTTGETHVAVTDENGEFRSKSSWESHAEDTNKNDEAVTGYRIVQDVNGEFRPDVTDVVVDESKLDAEAGIWFGVSEPDDEHGALIYDSYSIVELEVSGNAEMAMVTMPRVVISREAYDLDMGTIDNRYEEDEYLWTEVRDAVDGDKRVAADPEAEVIDRVEMHNLAMGYDYVLRASMVFVDTEEPVLDASGAPIVGETRFTAELPAEPREVSIRFDSVPLKGRDVVVYERLYQIDLISGEELEVAVHESVEDTEQQFAVTVPSHVTELVDRKTGTHTINADPSSELDAEVDYRNLVPGLTYEITGELFTVDPETGEKVPVTDSEGNPVKTTTTFTPKDGNGHTSIPFDDVDTSYLVDREVIVETVIERIGSEISTDSDPDDVIGRPGDGKPGDPDGPAGGDTPTYPDPDGDGDDEIYVVPGDKVGAVKGATLSTYLASSGTRDKVIVADSEAAATDTVTMTGLVPGYEYDLVSVLVDRKTGRPVLNAQVGERTYAEFSSALFDTLGLGTASGGAFDPTAGAWSRYPAKLDVKSIEDLVGAKRYAGTGSELVWARTSFTAKGTEQTVDVDYKFDARKVTSTDVTACTMLVQRASGLLVAGDLDLALDAQSAEFVRSSIDTVATDATDGDKYVMNGASAQVRDRVTYENLVAGKEYVLVTTVRHAGTGEQAYVADEPIRSETRFVPAASSGKFDAFATFDARALEDDVLVVYEELYRDMNTGGDKAELVLVAEHCDPNDADQTFAVDGNGTYDPNRPGQINRVEALDRLNGGSGLTRLSGGKLGALASTGGDDSDSFAKTAARDKALPMAAILLVALGAAGLVLAARNARRKED